MGMQVNRAMAAAIAAGLWLGALSAAQAQEAPARPSGPPPSWDSLIPCAQKADPAEGFACYQAAVRAAGYAPNPEVAASERRRRFGMSLPFTHKEKPKAVARAERRPQPGQTSASESPAAPEASEDGDKVMVQLSQVAVIPPQNRLLLVTAEGAIWEQTDDEAISPRPRPGQSIQIEHTGFGGYFCRFDKLTKVRCTRTH